MEEKHRVVIEFSGKGANVVEGSFKSIANEAKKSRRAVDAFKDAVKTTGSRLETLKEIGQRTFSVLSKSIQIALAPLKLMIGAVVTLKTSLFAMGLATLKASAEYEALNAKLRTVLGTAEKANKAFAESKNFSVATPFTTQQIVEVRTLLESVGVAGQDAVKAVAEASAAMSRDINDVARAVLSLESEPLKNLGIILRTQTAGQGKNAVSTYTFNYTQGDTEIQKQVQGLKNAQQELLKIFTAKFEGGILRMSKTLVGLISTFKDASQFFFAKIGDQILPAAKVIVSDIIDLLKKIDMSGLGEKLGEELLQLRATFIAATKIAVDIAKAIQQVNKDKGVGEVILTAIKLGARLFGNIFIATIKATYEIWNAIGQIIGTAIYNFLINSDLPFARGAKKSASRKAFKEASDDQLRQVYYGSGGMKKDASAEHIREWVKIRSQQDDRVMQALIETSHKNQLGEQLTQSMSESAASLEKIVDQLVKDAGTSLDTTLNEAGIGKDQVDLGNFDTYRQQALTEGEKTKETLSTDPADAMKGQADAVKEVTEAVSLQTQMLDGLKAGWAEWSASAADIQTQIGNIAVQGLNGLTQAIDQMVMGGKANFKELALSVVTSIRQMIIQMLIMKAISMALGIPIGAVAPSGGGGGGGGGGGLFSGMMGSQFGNALAAGEPSWTGEAGREMVIPQSAGYVVPNAASERLAKSDKGGDSMGGGGVRIINVTDASQVEDYLATSNGERVVMNVLKRNRGALQGLLRA